MGHFWVNETNEVNETNGSKVTSSQTYPWQHQKIGSNSEGFNFVSVCSEQILNML